MENQKARRLKTFLMNYKIILSDVFKKKAKQLVKKYPSLKLELEKLGNELSEKPDLGTPLGNDVYKIRLAIASKGKGKSGGARIISYIKVIETSVILLIIYNKGERASISDEEIKELLNKYI